MNCPICEVPVIDYAPGISAVKHEGVLYHPSCLEEATGQPLETTDPSTSREESPSPVQR